jgi:peptide/nickel transport system substrate-binding protein
MAKRLGPSLLAALLLSASLLAACGKAAPAAATVGRDRTLVEAISDNPDTLNPYLHTLAADGAIFALVFQGLVRLNMNDQWEPVLATEVPTLDNGGISKDGLTWTFHLRKDVKWSDGQPFTARDVKFTAELANNKAIHITYAQGFDKIAAIDTPDDYTVVYHLKQPYAPFMESVAASDIVPEHILSKLTPDEINKGAEFNTKPVGTGPYQVDSFKADDSVVLSPNKYYWGPKPKIDRIVIKIVPDGNTQLNMLKTGDLDIVGSVPPNRVDEVKAWPNVKMLQYIRATYALVQLDELNFLKDVKVRQALNMATPKDKIVHDVMKDQAVVAWTDQVPNGSWYADLPHPSYDLNAAKQLLLSDGFTLDKDGYMEKGGKVLEVPIWTVAGRDYYTQAAQLIADSWKQIGVKTSVQTLAASALFGQNGPQFDGKDEALLFGWGQGVFPDDTIDFNSKYITYKATDAGENGERYANPLMDQLTEAGTSTVDDAKRHDIYKQIQQLEIDTVPIIFLYWFQGFTAYASRLQGYDCNTFACTPVEQWSLASGK